MSRINLLLTVLVMFLLASAFAMAQNAPPQDNNNGGRRTFDPAQFRQRMAERMKADLKVTDEEWTVLQPKVEKVQTLERDLRGGMFGGRMGRRGGPDAAPAENQPEQSEVAKASTDLRTALADENTPASSINEKLLALRTAKAKVQTELEIARKDLKELLTPRQEAVLVMQGVLE